jgi:hypothetical protein
MCEYQCPHCTKCGQAHRVWGAGTKLLQCKENRQASSLLGIWIRNGLQASSLLGIWIRNGLQASSFLGIWLRNGLQASSLLGIWLRNGLQASSLLGVWIRNGLQASSFLGIWIRNGLQASSLLGIWIRNGLQKQLVNKEAIMNRNSVKYSEVCMTLVAKAKLDESELCRVLCSAHVQCIDPVPPRPRTTIMKPPLLGKHSKLLCCFCVPKYFSAKSFKMHAKFMKTTCFCWYRYQCSGMRCRCPV